MPKRKPSVPYRAVMFRMPQEWYDLLKQVEVAKGCNMSSLINSLIADGLPALREWLKAHPVVHDDGFPLKINAG